MSEFGYSNMKAMEPLFRESKQTTNTAISKEARRVPAGNVTPL